MSGDLLSGVDAGTASTEGAITRPDGEVREIAERPRKLSMPRPERAEHDAERGWVDVTGNRDGLPAKADDPAEAPRLSGIGPCFRAGGRDGDPPGPAILCGSDMPAFGKVGTLMRQPHERPVGGAENGLARARLTRFVRGRALPVRVARQHPDQGRHRPLGDTRVVVESRRPTKGERW